MVAVAIILLVGDEVCLLEQLLLMMLEFPDHGGGIWSSAVGDVKLGLIMREEVVDVSWCQFLSGSTFSSGSAPTRPTSCTPACRRKSARTAQRQSGRLRRRMSTCFNSSKGLDHTAKMPSRLSLKPLSRQLKLCSLQQRAPISSTARNGARTSQKYPPPKKQRP